MMADTNINFYSVYYDTISEERNTNIRYSTGRTKIFNYEFLIVAMAGVKRAIAKLF